MNQGIVRKVAKSTALKYLMLFAGLFFYQFAVAQGLDTATDEVNEIRDWAYGFLGAACFLYLIWMVILALLDKKQWGDVGMAVVYVAIAGGIIVAGEFAWSVWGS